MVIKVNDMDLRVLTLFTKGYNRDYYIREIERLLKVSSRTALVTLAKLEKIGILESKIRGKIKVYFIKKSLFAREFFIFAEQYKRIQFLSKNLLIKEVFEKIDKFVLGIVVVFGSYAKGTQKKDSDLDLFIVGKFDEKKIREIGKRYGVDINIKTYPLQIFKKEINKDILLNEIVKNHILICGNKRFVGGVLNWIK